MKHGGASAARSTDESHDSETLQAAAAIKALQKTEKELGPNPAVITPSGKEAKPIHQTVPAGGIFEGLKSTVGKHRSFYWEETEAGFESAHVDIAAMIKKTGVPIRVLYSHINHELADERALKSLPMALLLVILYALVNLNQNSVYMVNALQSTIDSDIAENWNFAFSDPGNMGFKGYYDVNHYGDFWSWMQRGMVPVYFPTVRSVSEASNLVPPAIDMREKNYFLWHNRKLGPARLMQEVAVPFDCPNPEMNALFEGIGAGGMRCNQVGSIDLNLHPVSYEVAFAPLVEEKSMTKWVEDARAQEAPGSTAASKLLGLEQAGWLNNQTARVEIDFLTYNAMADMLTMTRLHFMFPRTGHIWKESTYWTLKLKPYGDYWLYLYEALFYGQITFLFVSEMKEACKELRDNRFKVKAFLYSYLGFWNFVDWVSIVGAYIHMILWVKHILNLMDIEDRLVNMSDDWETNGCVNNSACTEFYESVFDEISNAGYFYNIFQIVGASYPIIIMLRLFKAFAAQPRLAIVTNTLYHCVGDLAHFLMVFIAIFMTYVLMAIALFGKEVAGFSSGDRAILTLFRMLMGDFDVDELEHVGRGYAFFYFFTFMVLMGMIMLNMVIAIIMDVYAETKMAALSSETLWEQTYELAIRGYRNWRKTRLPLPYVIQCLERHCEANDMMCEACGEDSKDHKPIKCHPGTCEKLLTDLQFSKLITDMGQKMNDSQATRVMGAAADRWSKVHTTNLDFPEVLTNAELITKRLDEVIANLGRYHQGAKTSDDDLIPHLDKDFPVDDPRKMAEMISLYKLLKSAFIRLDNQTSGRSGPAAAIRSQLVALQLLLTHNNMPGQPTGAQIRV
jgi:hypothetical protein